MDISSISFLVKIFDFRKMFSIVSPKKSISTMPTLGMLIDKKPPFTENSPSFSGKSSLMYPSL